VTSKTKPDLEFFIKCIPPKSTSQQKGIMMIGGKPRHFKKKKVAEAESNMLSLLTPFRPPKAFEGPLALEVTWTYPWRSSETKKSKAAGFKYCTTRPDSSNVIKLLEDCMTRLNFWNDDSQNSDLRIIRGWGDKPGIGVKITKLED